MSAKVAVTETAGPKVTVNEAGEVLVSIATGSVTIQGGLGDVVGPASATDNAIARFDSTTGKLIQNSGITIADGTTGTLAGTNTGDQTITLTGDVTGSGTGSFAATLANTAVTAGSYTAADITVDAKGRITAAANGVGGGGITALTGDVTASGSGSVAATIANDAVTYAKMQNVSAASRLLGRGSVSGSGDVQEITIGSGLSLSGTTLTATGSGDMLKSVYDPQNLSKISGYNGAPDTAAGGTGGYLEFNGGDGGSDPLDVGGNAGTITLNGATGVSGQPGGNGGIISMSGAPLGGNAGSIEMSGGDAAPAGSLLTHTGGGTIDTNVGYIELGVAIERTTLQKTSTAARTISLPDATGTLLLTDGSGASLTALNANNISSGTLAVARGGTGATTLSANAVILGNGTSAVQTVAPSTSGNVLTSNGTTWTSAAPSTTNPAGSGSELQFRSSGTAFGAVTDSSVSGAALTLGNAAALGTTTTPYLTLRNTTAAAAGAQQVSPSLVLEGQGWKTTATAASQTVRFRQNVLPVQGTTSPTGSWRLQSEINNSGTWNDTISVESGGTLRMIGGSAVTQSIRGPTVGIYDSGGNALGFCVGVTLISYVESNGFFLNGATQGYWILTDTALMRDAAGVFAQRNSTNAQTFRIYNTYSSSTNYERASLGWASNVFQVKPEKGSGGGSSRTAEFHTTETGVRWTSGAGTPEGAVTAPVGSLFTRTDGGASTTLYVKESGSGNTGWVAK